MARLISILLFVFGLCWLSPVYAQDKPSGALDFGVDVHHSMGDHNVLGIHARAMAVDRVPDKLLGRFAEFYGSVGVGLEGELVQFSVGLKLGVGLGTDYVVLFLASGLMSDGYVSIKDEYDNDQVKPGLGVPLMLGLWVDPIPGLYFYVFAEPSWAFFGGDRKTTPYIPFNWAWELRLRGGVGFDVSKVHIRLEYTFHQVDPHSWHIVSVGFGFSSKEMAKLGLEPVDD